MLVLAFDTATDVATSALLDDGRVLGERTSVPRSLLEDVDALLEGADAGPADLDALVVGTGPGSFTSTRIGLALARGLALALDLEVAGISTLEALAAATEDAYPVIDARRGEVFVAGPRAVAPDDLELDPDVLCVGSGAVRYRQTLEDKGAVVPPDGDAIHIPHARLHVSLAPHFGPAEAVVPIYVRAPDAKLRTSA
ncbi:MAG: tRNA (adenosine(37)-N6)-threonylcarbamoyltransferase complex dimerization subunit type 1 TsaB [Actinobacteria bacterium]|nr:tRNA (adenosine(37)-N6)-threonylcarbamoyltransferase complex dimerization subunit type 1 TsaB [Actinomycetota bacterium]